MMGGAFLHLMVYTDTVPISLYDNPWYMGKFDSSTTNHMEVRTVYIIPAVMWIKFLFMEFNYIVKGSTLVTIRVQ